MTDLRGDPADDVGGQNYAAGANRDHVFDGHYTVNGVTALFKSSGGSLAALGGVLGLAAGIGVGAAINSSREPDCVGFLCGLDEQMGIMLVSSAVGCALGAIAGGVLGSARATVFRFRPGTPQETRIVVSLSPLPADRSDYRGGAP